MQRCFRVTDAGLASVASAGQLKVLGAGKVHELTGLSIKALVATCRSEIFPYPSPYRHCSQISKLRLQANRSLQLDRLEEKSACCLASVGKQKHDCGYTGLRSSGLYH